MEASLARNSHDFDCVFKILDFLRNDESKPAAVYCVGRPQQNRPRLAKVVQGGSKLKQLDVLLVCASFRFKGAFTFTLTPQGGERAQMR